MGPVVVLLTQELAGMTRRVSVQIEHTVRAKQRETERERERETWQREPFGTRKELIGTVATGGCSV